MQIKDQLSEIYFDEISARMRAPLLSYVQSIIRDAAIAEDIVQETLLRAYKGMVNLKDQDRLTPWLYRIATNICHDHFRKNSRTREIFRGSEGVNEIRDENAPNLNKVMECTEMGECIQRYFDELSDSYRAVILLHDVEGLTNQEIANALGITLDAAKIRLHRSRKQLRNLLTDVCHFYIDERGILVYEPKESTGN